MRQQYESLGLKCLKKEKTLTGSGVVSGLENQPIDPIPLGFPLILWSANAVAVQIQPRRRDYSTLS